MYNSLPDTLSCVIIHVLGRTLTVVFHEIILNRISLIETCRVVLYLYNITLTTLHSYSIDYSTRIAALNRPLQ